MRFEEIPIRMLQLGVNRAWLSRECDYSLAHVGNILARADTKSKTPKALRRIWEALDREEARQQLPVIHFERHQVVLRPSDEEYRVWSEAQRKGGQPTLIDWATDTLNAATTEITASNLEGPTTLADWNHLPKIVG